MAIYYPRKLTGAEACGPGSRFKLSITQGVSAEVAALDATGDTWNGIAHTMDTSPFFGQMYAPGSWAAGLWLAAAGFGTTKVRAVLARYNSACVLQQTLVDSERTIIGSSFTLYTFTLLQDLVTFEADDILLLIVYETEGTATMETDQPGLNASRVAAPAIVTVRPHEYYKRQRRRRSC